MHNFFLSSYLCIVDWKLVQWTYRGEMADSDVGGQWTESKKTFRWEIPNFSHLLHFLGRSRSDHTTCPNS